MKKYFLTLCTLALGMLTTLWVCAQSENTAAEKAEKTPGEQLIEFAQNPPENFDLGGTEINNHHNTSFDKNVAFRVKRDGKNIFDSKGNESILSQENIGNLTSYRYIWSKYENAYWQYGGKSLTTWTNWKGETNIFTFNEKAKEQSILRYISFLAKPSVTNFVKEGRKWIGSGQTDEYNIKEEYYFDENGFLVMCTFQNELKDLSKAPPVELAGSITEYSYSKEMPLSFLPSDVNLTLITRYNEKPEPRYETNQSAYVYHFEHLELGKKFKKSDFELIPTEKDDNIKHYWVEGTNTLYQGEDNLVNRVLTRDEFDVLQQQTETRQSKYRGIYIVLACLGCALCIFLILRRKNDK